MTNTTFPDRMRFGKTQLQLLKRCAKLANDISLMMQFVKVMNLSPFNCFDKVVFRSNHIVLYSIGTILKDFCTSKVHEVTNERVLILYSPNHGCEITELKSDNMISELCQNISSLIAMSKVFCCLFSSFFIFILDSLRHNFL